MIYYLPLELIDKRYTKDLDKLIEKEFKKQGKEYTKITGEELVADKIDTGAFLDSNSTNYYKFSQLQQVCKLFAEGKIKDGDTFFISDLWFPGLEAIPYMAFFNQKKVNITGLLHAGSWTETDYVANMDWWAKYTEMGWFRFIDKIFVGSDQIKKEMIEKGRIVNISKIYKTGLPFNTEDCYSKAPYRKWEDKEDIVLFVGRLDDEKQPWLFEELARSFVGTKVMFYKTMAHDLNKKEYYDLLSRAKVVFSSALQENFGYGVLEAATYGCNLVLPNRLVYPEFYHPKFLYNSMEEAIVMTKQFLTEDNSKLVKASAMMHNHNVEKIVELI